MAAKVAPRPFPSPEKLRMLLDSNIIIYAARPENSELRRFIAQCTPAVSALSYVEVLGYHRFS